MPAHRCRSIFPSLQAGRSFAPEPMNVFVLCTGRSGSTTFFRACQHITNYSAGHELNTSEIGHARLHYPEDHIEVDNRLSWLLGRLDQAYGNRAFYVHLTRGEEPTARSFDRRWAGRYSIIRAYAEGVLRRKDQTEALCVDMVRTVNANIAHFLSAKSRTLTIPLEDAGERFPEFWDSIGAEGRIDDALREFDVRHNPSAPRASRAYARLLWKARSVLR